MHTARTRVSALRELAQETRRARRSQMARARRGVGGSLLALVALCCFQLLELAPRGAGGPPLVPAVFVLGDSTVDVGNNNFLERCDTGCKANYPHYGVDYPAGHAPTGRFSNGYNLADQLAQLLGFPESPPPFLSLSSSNESLVAGMSTGISFASGGSGLLDVTGNNEKVCKQVLSMSEQVGNFTALARAWGNAELLSRSLVFISVGSNDLFEYTDFPAPDRNDTEFLQGLVESYTGFLKELYGAGARKLGVVSPSLVGCCPSQRAIATDPEDPRGVDKYGCFAAANNLSRRLFPMVASMLQDLSAQLPGLNYSLVNSIRMLESVLGSASTPCTSTTPSYNFTVLDEACCGSGRFRADGCNATALLCGSRSSHLFWDDYHPTDAASGLAATIIFGDTTGLFVRPVNVQQLVAPPRP